MAEIRQGTNNTGQSPDNALVSNEQYYISRFICYNIIIPIVCAFGLVGNSLAVAVLVKTARQLQQSIFMYLSALTIVDTLYMVVMVIRCSIYFIDNFDKVLGNYIYSHTLSVIVVLDGAVTLISTGLMILMSLERLTAIRTPLYVRETIFAKRPALFIGTTVVCAFLLYLPLPFCMVIVADESNITTYEVVVNTNMMDFFRIYTVALTVLGRYLPFVTIMCLNIAIPIHYSRIMKLRKTWLSTVSTNSVINKQLRIMTTVLCVIVMHTLLTLPQMFIQTLSYIDTRFSMTGRDRNMFWLFVDISNVFATFNVAIDFIIYILMPGSYRNKFKNMFSKSCLQTQWRAPDDVITSTHSITRTEISSQRYIAK